MLVIRLRRTGRKKQATYNVVVAEKARAVKGKFLENLGSYNPTVNPKEFTYNIERIQHWIANGAKPSDTVASLLKNDGVAGMEKFIEPKDKQRKKKKEVEEAPAAEAAAPEAAAEGGGDAPADAPAETAEAPAEEKAEEPAAEEAPEEKAEEASE